MLRILARTFGDLRFHRADRIILFSASADAQTVLGYLSQALCSDFPWNSRPVARSLGDFIIPSTSYFPAVTEGAFSTGVFLSKIDDKPVTVGGPAGHCRPPGSRFRDQP